MSIPSPPYLLEYRAARAMMEAGNIGPAKLVDMLNSGDAFLFDGDRKDYQGCALCKDLVNSHPDCFLKSEVSDLPLRGAIVAKLIEGGKLIQARVQMADMTIKMVAVAGRKGLNCVIEPTTVIWDNFAACKAAHVTAISIEDFIAAL